MTNDNNPTTRRYPRTLLEAFPQDANNWEYIERPDRHITFWDVVLWVLATVIIGFFIWYWTTK